MNKSFENLYTMLAALSNGAYGTFLKAAHTFAMDDNAAIGEAAGKEAAKLLELMDSYKEPVLPFENVSAEDINSRIRTLGNLYGHILWTNQMTGTDEDCAIIVHHDPETYMGYSEEDIRNISRENSQENRDIMEKELATIDAAPVIIAGTIKCLYGLRPVLALFSSLDAVFRVFTGNKCTLYVKNGHLRAQNVHNDGADEYIVCTLKEGASYEVIEMLYQGKDHIIDRVEDDPCVESFVPVLNKHFGWEDPV